MRSLGFKNGLEWVEVEIPAAEIGVLGWVAAGLARGIDPKRFGWLDDEKTTAWVQGTRREKRDEGA